MNGDALAPPSRPPIWAWQPEIGMQFHDKKEFTEHFRFYQALHCIKFRVEKDTGVNVIYRCTGCKIGMVKLYQKKQLNTWTGQYFSDPPTIKAVEWCLCGIPVPDFANLASFQGKQLASRSDFTSLGRVYFFGRPHSRQSCGNRILYCCEECREGKLSASLVSGISKKTGTATWMPPLTIESAVACRPECSGSADVFMAPVDEEDLGPECIFCLEEAADPIKFLCCPSASHTPRFACRQCLQEWIKTRPAHLRVQSDNDNDHSQARVLAFSLSSSEESHYYSCPVGGCNQHWKEDVWFSYGSTSQTLRELFDIPVGFNMETPIMNQVQLVKDRDEYEVARKNYDPKKDETTRTELRSVVAEQPDLDRRRNVLVLNGYTDPAAYLAAERLDNVPPIVEDSTNYTQQNDHNQRHSNHHHSSSPEIIIID